MIDKNTEEALKSNEFLSMDRSFLNQLVERNSLNIREVELFKAVDCWAKEECKRQQLEANGPVKRQVLGVLVKKIRFPVMKEEEFEDVVVPRNILTSEETREISKYFSSTLNLSIGFLDVHRVGPFLRCCSFKNFLPNACHVNDPEVSDWMVFGVYDRDIMLHGVSILGNDGGEYTVTLKVTFVDSDDNNLLCATKTGTYTSRRKAYKNGFCYGFDVTFDKPCVVEADDYDELSYIIEALVSGPGRCLGNEMIFEVEHSGVRIGFDHSDGIITDPIHGQLSRNPFAELLFTVKE